MVPCRNLEQVQTWKKHRKRQKDPWTGTERHRNLEVWHRADNLLGLEDKHHINQ